MYKFSKINFAGIEKNGGPVVTVNLKLVWLFFDNEVKDQIIGLQKFFRITMFRYRGVLMRSTEFFLAFLNILCVTDY